MNGPIPPNDADELDILFEQDLRTHVEDWSPVEYLSPQEVAKAAIIAWEQCRPMCESPIEERLLEKIIFADDGWMPVRWHELTNAYLEEPDRYGSFTNPDFNGVVFSLQEEVPPYRADFMFRAIVKGRVSEMIVECDGHDFHEKTKEQAQRDKARDRFFAAEGMKVLRFTGSEIYRDADKCLKEINGMLFGMTLDLIIRCQSEGRFDPPQAEAPAKSDRVSRRLARKSPRNKRRKV